MRTETPKTIYLNDYRKPDYLVSGVELTFRIFDDRTLVTARTHFYRNGDPGADLILNGENLTLKSVSLGGRILQDGVDYKVDEKHLTLPAPAAESFTLTVETEIDPAANTRLDGLYRSQGTYCTQCEAQGFRTITYFQDRPDIMTVFTVRIEADKAACPVLLSNGNLREEGELGDGRHFAVWHDPFPKPCYLFALVAGDLVHIQDFFTTKSGRKVDLRIYVKDGDQSQCYWAMESLINSMKWDEEVYGREYQLDRFNIVAVSDFNMGAMENTSLNIFNTALVLADPETATDRDFERVEAVIAHEYFHNWTGNRVTCRDWFQLSLKEGLTVFRDQTFSGDLNSHAVKRIDDVDLLRKMQFAEDAGPMAHPVRPDNYIEINNFYTVTVYEKGAEVIRMQNTLLGPQNYRKATDLYFDRFDGQAVTCEDFVQCMEDASGLDMKQFFNWYTQAGTPEIEATSFYDAQKKEFTLELSQSQPATPGQPHKDPLHIPVRFGLIGPNGEDMIEERILHLREKTQRFVFDNIPVRPVPSILRGFSAPVKLRTDLTNDDLRFLMVHDTDGFNRWEAGQTYALRMLNAVTDQVEGGKAPEIWPEFLQSFGDLLDQAFRPGVDKALLARALSLPDITVIGHSRETIDPLSIHIARESVIRAILAQFGERILTIYNENRSPAAFRNDFAARSQRSLQNLLLHYLGKAKDTQAVRLAKTQYDAANNMTDRVAALAVLADIDCAEREEAFAHFYGRFKAYPLVIDKWFAIQAASLRGDILDHVRALKAHPDFTMKTPNRVRSLLSAFAMNNPASFHDASGSGYAFLTDAIIELNTINPQIAARMLTPMRDWKRYTKDRQALIRDNLKRIAALQNLSDNVYEIVTKTLNA